MLVLFSFSFLAPHRFLDAHTNQALNVGQDGVYLYRGMLAPAVPNLVFVGAEVSSA